MAIKKKKVPSKVHYSVLMIIGVFLMVLAVSCQTADPQIVEEPTLEQEEEVLESPEPTASDPNEITEAQDEGESAEVDQCLVCHTDQDTLMDTADPVVDLESESSGEG
jgi:hypothetical protein